MKAAVLALVLVLLEGLLVPGSALAQRDDGARHRSGAAMSSDQRQRMREEMREVYRQRGGDRGEAGLERGARPERPRQLSPEERAKLRQDVQNANKDLRR
jgi:hypothetical protein